VFGAGTTITSTKRTPGHNAKAGGAANSYHLTGNAVDFIPQGGMRAFDKEMLRLALEAKGIKVLELLGPGDPKHDDHGHVAFDFKRLGPDQVAKSNAAEAARQNARELGQMRWTNAAGERLEALMGDLLAAEMELVEGTEAQAKFAGQLVESYHRRIQRDIENDAAEAKKAGLDAETVDLQSKALIELNTKVKNQKLTNIEIRKQMKLAQEANELARQRSDFQIDELQFQDEMATTRKEHLRLQLDMVDIVYQQKKKDLEFLLLQEKRNGNIAAANRIQEQINNLPRERERDVERTERSNESPFDTWVRDASDISDELDSLKVRGIEGVVDALVALKDGWGAMRDVALQAIGDIISELLRLQIMKMIANIASGGSGNPFAGETIEFASGGRVRGPGTGTSDSIPALLSNGEFVVNAKATEKYAPLLEAINSGKALRLAVGGMVTPRVAIPKAANINIPTGRGDSYSVNVNLGDRRLSRSEARRTGAQIASGMQEQIARTKQRGM
jgi:hypothetical protein